MLRLGDVRDVVVEISLDLDGFEWLVNELEFAARGYEDGFVRELREALEGLYPAPEEA